MGDKLVAHARGGSYLLETRPAWHGLCPPADQCSYTLVATVRPSDAYDVLWPYPVKIEAVARATG